MLPVRTRTCTDVDIVLWYAAGFPLPSVHAPLNTITNVPVLHIAFQKREDPTHNSSSGHREIAK
jgi:hypothetical protein